MKIRLPTQRDTKHQYQNLVVNMHDDQQYAQQFWSKRSIPFLSSVSGF
jgi:hypothetical protein